MEVVLKESLQEDWNKAKETLISVAVAQFSLSLEESLGQLAISD